MGSCRNMSYMMFGLQSEVGELSGKIAKAIRHGDAAIGGDGAADFNHFMWNFCEHQEDFNEFLAHTREKDRDMMLELGDIMWFCAGIAEVMGWDLDDVCQANLDKLAARAANNTIDGDGDHR